MSYYNLVFAFQQEFGTPSQIIKRGGVTSKFWPEHLKVPGGEIAVIQDGNGSVRFVSLRYTVQCLVPLPRVKYPNGKITKNVYLIKADPNTFVINPPMKIRTRIHWGRRAWYEAGFLRRAFLYDSHDRSFPEWAPHNYAETSENRSNREFELVDKYVRFMGSDTRFGRRLLQGTGMRVDLFDLLKNRLIEAKVLPIDDGKARKRIREGFGQLYDYKRFLTSYTASSYSSSFRNIGLLLDRDPGDSNKELLRRYRVAVIWLESNKRDFLSIPRTWCE